MSRLSDHVPQVLDIQSDGETLDVDAINIPRWQTLRLPKPFSPELEAAFSRDHNARMVPIRRTATLLAMVLWVAFMFVDYAFSRSSSEYLAVAPWLVATRVLAFFVIWGSSIHFFSDPRVLSVVGYADRVMLIASSLTYAAMCLATVLVPVFYDQLYFFNGMIVVIVGSFVLYGIRAREALMLACVHVVLSLPTILWCQYGKAGASAMQEASLVPVTTLMLMGASILIGYSSSLLVEAYARRNFLGRHALAIQTEKMFRHGQEMERLNRELERSSQEAQSRMQAVIELKEKLRQEAERRNRDKSQFIASAVHDLRQPVQAVMTALYPVAHALDRGDRQTVDELLHLTSRAVNALNDQLLAILDLSRLESGNVRPELEIVDVRAETIAIFSAWKALSAGQVVCLELHLPPEEQTAISRTDANFFKRIVSNLISNSIKYCDPGKPEGAQVAVTLHVLPTGMRLEVSDNGIGIDQEIIDNGQIFHPFFQANNTRAQGDKGVGLGLTIVSALTALLPDHGLTIRSEIGRGSTFSLDLPISDATLPEIDREFVQAMDVGCLAGTYVVLIEDDDLVRQATAKVLELIGIRCDPYDSFEQLDRALLTMERIPDIVLSDFRLPNGRCAIDVREAINEFVEGIPFVVFSGEAMDLSALPGLQGVPILRKPLSVEALVQTLREVVEKTRLPADTQIAGGVGSFDPRLSGRHSML